MVVAALAGMPALVGLARGLAWRWLSFCVILALALGAGVKKSSSGYAGAGRGGEALSATAGGMLLPIVDSTAVPTGLSPGALTEGGVDPCLKHESCTRCVEDRRCGYCGSNGMCAAGGPTGAKALKCAASWSFMYCTGESCRNYRNCVNCIADPSCAFCPVEEGGGRCGEGNQPGGGATGKSKCPVPWLRSLVRRNMGNREASVLAFEHVSYLNDICEGNGTLVYKHPPPALPPPPSHIVSSKSLWPLQAPLPGRNAFGTEAPPGTTRSAYLITFPCPRSGRCANGDVLAASSTMPKPALLGKVRDCFDNPAYANH